MNESPKGGFEEKLQNRIARTFIWFAPKNVPYYQKDTEPKLYPDAFVKYVPLELLEQCQEDLSKYKRLASDEADAAQRHGKRVSEMVKEIQELREQLAEQELINLTLISCFESIGDEQFFPQGSKLSLGEMRKLASKISEKRGIDVSNLKAELEGADKLLSSLYDCMLNAMQTAWDGNDELKRAIISEGRTEIRVYMDERKKR